MCTLDPAASFVHGGNVDLLHTQRLQPYACADHVGNGVKGSHLVKVHILGGHSVDLSFSLCNPLEDAQGMLLYERRQVAVLDQLTDLAVRPTMHLVVLMMVVMVPAAFVAVIMVMLVTRSMMVVPVLMPVMVMMRVGVRMRMLLLVPVFCSGNFTAVV